MATNRPEFDADSAFAHWEGSIASGSPIETPDLFKLGKDIVRLEAARREEEELPDVLLTMPTNDTLHVSFDRYPENKAVVTFLHLMKSSEEEIYEVRREGPKGHERFTVLWGIPSGYSPLAEDEVTEDVQFHELDERHFGAEHRITVARNIWQAYIHTLQRQAEPPS